ncbi:MAG: tetratricopeptide repeat protein [Planctomycetes bacterium]|nr:tetratricopeptide repeat protein [Planctomycetota bacterium]
MVSDPRERRIVTIAFSEVSGVARLSETRDPESVRVLVDDLFRRFRTAIEAEGGAVDKFIGDTVMAVFGAPVAHSDDPARSARAAFALKRVIDAFNAEHSLQLGLRSGVNMGEVLWGSVGGEAPTVMGDAVNVAQRLESSARSGAVLVSAAVERAARRAIRFAPWGPVKVKGREEPVETFEAEDVREQTEEGLPLAGRDAERATLAAALPSGGFFLVEGEAGMGKSRLAAEVRRDARARGLRLGSGRCPEGAKLPLSAFGDILRADAGNPGFEEEDAPGIAAAVAAQLEAAVPDAVTRENLAALVVRSVGYALPGARVAGIDPSRMATEERHAWICWIGARLPALLLIEDLHYADAGTVALLESLAAVLAGRGLTLIATARPGGSAPAGYAKIELRELPPGAVAGLAAATLGAPVDPSFASFLVDQTAGNPLYVEELARFLEEEGDLEGSPVRLKGSPRMPAGMNALLVARLDALPPAHKDALKGASTVGRVFWDRFLARMLERDVNAAVAEALDRGLVAPSAGSLLPDDEEFAFRHALLRDAAYSLLTKRERQRLHLRAAELLESRLACAARPLRALCARHREAAGDPAGAASHWLAAAQAAWAAAAVDEALGAAREASRLGAGAPARLVAADALRVQGRFAESLSEAVAALAEDPAVRVAALLAAGRAHRSLGNLAANLEAVEQALREAAEPGLRAEAQAELAVVLHVIGDYDRSLEFSIGAAEAARALPPTPHATRILAHALLTRTFVLRLRGNFEEARRIAEDALAVARTSEYQPSVAAVLTTLGVIHKQCGRFEEALTCHRDALAVNQQIGDRSSAAGNRVNIANVLYWHGECGEAEHHLRDAIALYRAIGARERLSDALLNLGVVLNSTGAIDASIEAETEALRLAEEIGSRENRAIALGNLGIAHKGKGDYAAALVFYRQAGEIFAEAGNLPGQAATLMNLGGVLRLLRRPGDAVVELERALEIRRRTGYQAGMDGLLAELKLAREEAERGACGAAEGENSS